MTLKDYIKKNGIKQYKFAEQLGVTPSTVHSWMNGVKMPRPAYLQAIKEITKGEVMPNDFL